MCAPRAASDRSWLPTRRQRSVACGGRGVMLSFAICGTGNARTAQAPVWGCGDAQQLCHVERRRRLAPRQRAGHWCFGKGRRKGVCDLSVHECSRAPRVETVVWRDVGFNGGHQYTLLPSLQLACTTQPCRTHTGTDLHTLTYNLPSFAHCLPVPHVDCATRGGGRPSRKHPAFRVWVVDCVTPLLVRACARAGVRSRVRACARAFVLGETGTAKQDVHALQEIGCNYE